MTENRESIKKAIKQSFESGNTLTTLDGLNLFRTLEMRKFVSLLRAEGMNIGDRWVKAKNGKRFKQYFVNKQLDLGCCFNKKLLLLF